MYCASHFSILFFPRFSIGLFSIVLKALRCKLRPLYTSILGICHSQKSHYVALANFYVLTQVWRYKFSSRDTVHLIQRFKMLIFNLAPWHLPILQVLWYSEPVSLARFVIRETDKIQCLTAAESECLTHLRAQEFSSRVHITRSHRERPLKNLVFSLVPLSFFRCFFFFSVSERHVPCAIDDYLKGC